MDSDASGSAVSGAASGAGAGAAVGGPWGAAIGAGVGLIGGLLSASARRDAEKRRMKFEAEMMGLQKQADAGKAWTEGSQAAFAQMMQGYQALGR